MYKIGQMPGCKYPQRRNSKSGRCKKPCKKSQKVSKSTGRCVSRCKPAPRRRRKTCKRRKTTRRPVYYDNYIPGYAEDIFYDTDEEMFHDASDGEPGIVSKLFQTAKNVVGLGETETKPVNIVEEARQQAANNIEEAVNNRADDLEFSDARETEPEVIPDPVVPEVIPDPVVPEEYYDSVQFPDTTLNKQSMDVMKGDISCRLRR